ncbi:complex I subunit 1/NuoH family protein [Xanthovirga aplysinae]|uniref:complex I subunit 1/NuoH family protein n=1 Tax=Xanthovirga aplysinae TaxID=2529853 RepID=UPI0012BC09EC|nr:complex I subunit 1 family protein [Xanthovirga aplysinae]MTI32130.1 NADH-quinone oxidoreductase subunit H [Xanthovirga aplysinae]
MTTFFFFLPLVLIYALFAVYIERKIAAFIHDRLGPMEVGKYGLAQTLADILKLIQKEDIIPASADRKLFMLGPVVVFVAFFAAFAVIPITSSWAGSAAEVGVFYLLAIVSMDVLGILMAGWGSNSKFSLFGAMRSAAQIVSYEVPLGLSILCVVMIAQSLNLQEISFQQGIWINTFKGELAQYATEKNYLFGIKTLGIDVTQWGGIFSWNIIRMPFLLIAYVIFFIASLAQANRGPFDLPEAESELVSGYHTEYSGFRFAVFMLSEYGVMLLVSFLGAILFLGSWNTPFPNIGILKLAEWTSGAPGTVAGFLWGAFWLLSKTFLTILIQMWLRWSYPRLRVDQLMGLCWKYLTPAALVLILLSGVWRMFMIL